MVFIMRSRLKRRLLDGEVFDLEKTLVDRFVQKGRDRKEIVFLTTGIGAAHTTYGCINSHYFDPTKHVDGTKGFFRTKQAGRTGLGTVMIDKKIRAIVVLAEFPHGENPYGAADWDKAKQAGARLGKVVREVDPQSLKMYRKGSAGLIAFMNKAGVPVAAREQLPVGLRSAGGADHGEILRRSPLRPPGDGRLLSRLQPALHQRRLGHLEVRRAQGAQGVGGRPRV